MDKVLGIILGIDTGTDPGYPCGSFGGSNDGNHGGSVDGNSLVKWEGTELTIQMDPLTVLMNKLIWVHLMFL